MSAGGEEVGQVMRGEASMDERGAGNLAGRAFAMLIAAILLGATTVPALGAERVALVIGNAAYEHTDPLRNPENDAKKIAQVLAELDFKVIKGLNLDKNAFGTKLREFSLAAQEAEVTLFFYAGHGLQVDGENYLVPVDAKLRQEVDLRLEAFELAAFMGQMRSRTNLVFLDACRDNPLAGTLARSMGVSRSIRSSRGLSRVTNPAGTLIAYATEPGNVADDGAGLNSPFTSALLDHIATPGLSVNDMFTAVIKTVKGDTHGKQTPAFESTLADLFFFNPSSSPASPPSVALAYADEVPAARDLQYDGEFQECPQCPKMVVVPAGTYEMGSPSGEGAIDEERHHRVTIPGPIAIGMYEVRRAEFTHFMKETSRSGGSACWQYDGAETRETSGPADPGFIQGENEPMVCVSWEDAQAYVEWLSTKTKGRYRLLSEAEWEYAARGGTVAPRYWDESESGQCAKANGADIALRTRYPDWFELTAPCDDGRPHTSEAGSYGPNAFGLYDMLGNAREWVADCWNGDYTGAPQDGSAWTGSGNCGLRVLRGGSWLDGPGGVRSSTRDKGTTGIRFSANGFRVARVLD